MDGPHRSGPTPTDPDAGTSTWRPSAGYLAVALAIVAGALAYGLMPSPVPPPGPAAAGSAAQAPLPIAPTRPVMVAPQPAAASSPAVAAPVRAAVASVPASPPAPRIARLRDPDGDLTPDLSDYVNEGEKPTMGEVIDRLHQAGVYGGLGAFSPPGTRPPLVGLAVPEDFNLPEGYVRHHQATDDGQRIEPILMFSPDHRFFDAAGRPIAIPKDRVVPPELAPPGLPIRRVEIPAPAEPGSAGR